MTKSKVVSLRLPESTHSKLQMMTKESNVSIAKLLTRLIEKEAFGRNQKLKYWYEVAELDPRAINADVKLRLTGFKMESLGFSTDEIEDEIKRIGKVQKAMIPQESFEKAKAAGRPIQTAMMPFKL